MRMSDDDNSLGWNTRYLAYCWAMKTSPYVMLEYDTYFIFRHTENNFSAWLTEKIHQFGRTHPEFRHAAFDAWLAEEVGL